MKIEEMLRRLERRLDLPGDVLSRGTYLEMRGRGELLVCGCAAVVRYTPAAICLRLRQGYLTVRGEGLELCSYGYGSAGIHGRIDTVGFCGEEENGNDGQ